MSLYLPLPHSHTGWLSGSVSDLKLSPETTSHRNLLRLSSLICMLSFSFLFPLAVNFSAISFGAPQIRGEYHYSQVIMVRSVRALHALVSAAPPANGNRQKTDYDYVHSESAETATRATSWACPSLIRRTIVHLPCHCPPAPHHVA